LEEYVGRVVGIKVMRLAERITLISGLLFAVHVETCSAQVPVPWAAGRAPMQGTLPGYSRPTFNSEFPSSPMPSEEERMRKWKLQEKEAERKRLAGFSRTVEFEGLENGNELRVVPKGRRLRAGFVSTTNDAGFTLLDSETQQAIHLPYSEIEAIYVVRSRGENAKRFAEDVGMALLFIVTLPLTILAGISGWDGC
jgi:hypothetical protein